MQKQSALPASPAPMPSNPPADLADWSSDKEFAAFIKCSPHTIRNSRVSGVLLGRPAPAFVKQGRRVRYRRDTVLSWLAQFTEQTTAKA